MVFEVNFDGLIGPTYIGAAATEQNTVSYPKAAALQGIQKMRTLVHLGYRQGFFPPQLRPEFSFLRQLGFEGDDATVLHAVSSQAPHLLTQSYSSSSMWASNSATVTPSADSQDGKVHITPANLISSLHRALECQPTANALRHVFADTCFKIHPPITAHKNFADEGAANHHRICADYGKPGVGLFVHGDGVDSPQDSFVQQTLEASRGVARQHGVLEGSVFIQQNPQAIAAGAFHNDVLAVANGPVLLHHELAFEPASQALAFARIKKVQPAFKPIFVPSSLVSLSDAIESGLFNAQLLASPQGDMDEMILVAPLKCAEHLSVREYLEALSRDDDQPIRDVVFVDLAQTSGNRGGPAAMRLRVVVTDEEFAGIDPRFLATDAVLDELERWVNQFYREKLFIADLAQPEFMEESIRALRALEVLLEIEGFYGF